MFDYLDMRGLRGVSEMQKSIETDDFRPFGTHFFPGAGYARCYAHAVLRTASRALRARGLVFGIALPLF